MIPSLEVPLITQYFNPRPSTSLPGLKANAPVTSNPSTVKLVTPSAILITLLNTASASLLM